MFHILVTSSRSFLRRAISSDPSVVGGDGPLDDANTPDFDVEGFSSVLAFLAGGAMVVLCNFTDC